MACSTNFPIPASRDDPASSDSSKGSVEPSERARATNQNVHQPSRQTRPLVAPLIPPSMRRMSEQSSQAGSGAAQGQPASPPPTIAILLILFDSQNSPGRSSGNGVLHVLSSLSAASLPMHPPAVSLIPRAFLGRPGERPHQLEQFSTPRYAHHMLSTSRIPTLQRASETSWTPLGPLAGLIDGSTYTTATVPLMDLEDGRTKTFLEALAQNMPAGRLPFDPRRAHVLFLAPIERRYADSTPHPPNPAGPAPLPSVRQLLPPQGQGAPSYPGQASANSQPPSGLYGPEHVKQEAEASPLYRTSALPSQAYSGGRSQTPGQGRLRGPPQRENPYILYQTDSPEDDPSPNRSSESNSQSPQASLSPQTAYRPMQRSNSRVSPVGSTTGSSRAYAHRSATDDTAFPYIASYLANRFPDVAAALERRGNPAPSLNGPWWFQTHTSAFMHVCNTLDMPSMRETQFFLVPLEELPGPPSANAPWDGRITADDVARWFASFPKSNSVARSTIRNHVGVLRRWQTLWERAEMQYFRDRGMLARPLPGNGPERDAYLATELLGVLGFVFAANAQERQTLLVQGMHPQALERCANRWPWGEVEEKIVRYFPEFGPKRRPRDASSAGGSGAGAGGSGSAQ